MKWLITISYEHSSDDAAVAGAHLRTALPDSARITTVQADPFADLSGVKEGTDRMLDILERAVPKRESWEQEGA